MTTPLALLGLGKLERFKILRTLDRVKLLGGAAAGGAVTVVALAWPRAQAKTGGTETPPSPAPERAKPRFSWEQLCEELESGGKEETLDLSWLDRKVFVADDLTPERSERLLKACLHSDKLTKLQMPVVVGSALLETPAVKDALEAIVKGETPTGEGARYLEVTTSLMLRKNLTKEQVERLVAACPNCDTFLLSQPGRQPLAEAKEIGEYLMSVSRLQSIWVDGWSDGQLELAQYELLLDWMFKQPDVKEKSSVETLRILQEMLAAVATDPQDKALIEKLDDNLLNLVDRLMWGQSDEGKLLERLERLPEDVLKLVKDASLPQEEKEALEELQQIMPVVCRMLKTPGLSDGKREFLSRLGKLHIDPQDSEIFEPLFAACPNVKFLIADLAKGFRKEEVLKPVLDLAARVESPMIQNASERAEWVEEESPLLRQLAPFIEKIDLKLSIYDNATRWTPERLRAVLPHATNLKKIAGMNTARQAEFLPYLTSLPSLSELDLYVAKDTSCPDLSTLTDRRWSYLKLWGENFTDNDLRGLVGAEIDALRLSTRSVTKARAEIVVREIKPAVVYVGETFAPELGEEEALAVFQEAYEPWAWDTKSGNKWKQEGWNGELEWNITSRNTFLKRKAGV